MNRKSKPGPDKTEEAGQKEQGESSSSGNVEKEQRSVVKTEIRQATWAGPLPPPNVIREYDEIVENGAERIFSVFEREGEHRRDLQKTELRLQGRDLVIGKVLSLVFLVFAFGLAAFAIAHDQPWVAGIISAGALSTIALGFMRVFGDNSGSNKED